MPESFLQIIQWYTRIRNAGIQRHRHFFKDPGHHTHKYDRYVYANPFQKWD